MAWHLPALDAIDVRILAGLSATAARPSEIGAAGRIVHAHAKRVRRLEEPSSRDIRRWSRLRHCATGGRLCRIILEKRPTAAVSAHSAVDAVVECWEVSGAVDYRPHRLCRPRRLRGLTSDLIDDPDLGVARVVSHVALRPTPFCRVSGPALKPEPPQLSIGCVSAAVTACDAIPPPGSFISAAMLHPS
jgi:hypothetical protein